MRKRKAIDAITTALAVISMILLIFVFGVLLFAAEETVAGMMDIIVLVLTALPFFGGAVLILGIVGYILWDSEVSDRENAAKKT